ncbi:hypothetical protein CLF_110815 [Clonorchis sinensis]|uniref:Uncharacterized protein n=1 Tax=Clonorchis sinensis TaxID=79923 RepID=H2KUY9_CLOSI|nr:hypothetical protein CLF_110815 [Clonorchis sinensis]
MTAVWTAMSLQRRDGGSSSLSRSLGSLMSPRLGEDHSTVVLYSNMSPNFVPSGEQRSHWSADEHLGLSSGSARGLSTLEPKLQKITTDSASSIMYLGKRIVREYQCTFVLPDEQQIGATRIETFMPEDGNSGFTLSLSVAAPPDQSIESRSMGPIRQRIEQFLSTADWKSAMLASSESKDAELLGHLSSKYSNSVSRRSRFERSESQKRRHEMVRAREVFSDEEDEVQFSSDDEPAFKPGPFPTGSSDGPHVLSPPRTISPDPLVTERITVSHGPLRRPASSAPPIIAHAEPPGRRQAPVSDAKSRQKFEELRRTWDERVAREQSFIDEQPFSPALSAHSRAAQYIEGHRGAAVTSILPTIPGRKRAPELSHAGVPHTSSLVPTQGNGTVYPVKRFLSGEGTHLPETYKSPSLPESSELVSPRFVTSPALSEPSTERGEKETRFGYNETSVRMNQTNVGRLEPRLPDDGAFHPSPADYRQTKSQSDTDYADFPSADDRNPWFPEQMTVGGATRQSQHAVPEFPVGYKGYQISARDLWGQRDVEMHPEVERKESFQKRTARTHSTPPYSDVEHAKVYPPDRPKSGDGLIEGTYVRHRVKYGNDNNVRSPYHPDPHTDKPKTTDFDASQRDMEPTWTSRSAFSVVEKLEDGSVSYEQTAKSTPGAVVKLADRKTFDELESKTVGLHREISSAHSRKYGIVRQRNVDENEALNYADRFFAPAPYRSRAPEATKQGPVPGRNAESDRKVHTTYSERTSSRPVKRSISEKVSSAVDSAQLKRDRIRRRKSDLDKHIDEQFDEAYREELIRKESLSAAGSGSREQASMSDLSELASQEAERNSRLARSNLRSRSYTSESGTRDVSKREKSETKGAEPVSPSEYQSKFTTGRKRWPPPPMSKGSPAKPTSQTVHPETKIANRDDASRLYAAERYKTAREQSGIGSEIPGETHTTPPDKVEEHTDQGRDKRRKANKNESGSDYRELDKAGQRQGLEPSQDDRDKFHTSPEHPSTEDGAVRLNLPSVRRGQPQKGLMVDEDKRTTAHKGGHEQGQPKKDEPFSPSSVVARGDHIYASVPQEKTRDDRRSLTPRGKVRDDRDIEPGGHEQPGGEDRVERPKSHTQYGHSHEWSNVDRYRTSEIHDKHKQKGRPGGFEPDFLFPEDEEDKRVHKGSHGDKTRRKSHDELESRLEKVTTDEQKLLRADFLDKRDDREKISKVQKRRGTEDAAERVKSSSTQHRLSHEQRMAGRSGISEDERKQRKEKEHQIGVSSTGDSRDKHGRSDSSKEKHIESPTVPTERRKLQSNLPHGHSEDQSGMKQHLSPGFERPRGDHTGVHRNHVYQGSEDEADYERSPATRNSRPRDQQTADWARTSKTYEGNERKQGIQRGKELGFPTNAPSPEKFSRPKSAGMRTEYDQQVPTDRRRSYDKSGLNRGQVDNKGEKSYVPAIGLLHDEKDRVHDGYGQLDTEVVKGRRKSHPTIADRPYGRKADDQARTTGDHDANDLGRHGEDELAFPAAEAARNKRERIYSPHKTVFEQPMKDKQKLGRSNYPLKTEVLSPVEPSNRDRSRSLLSPRPSLMSRSSRTDTVRPLSLPTASSDSFISSPVQLHSRQLKGDRPSEDRLVCMLEQTESEVKDSLRDEQAGGKSMGEEGDTVILSARSTVAPTYCVEEGPEPSKQGLRKSRHLEKEPDGLSSQNAPDEATSASKTAQKLGEQSPPLLPLTGSDLFRRRIGMELGQKHQEATKGRSKHTSYDPMASEIGDTQDSFPPTGRSATDPSKWKAQELHDTKPQKSSDLHQKRSSKQVPGEADSSTRQQPWSSARVEDSTRPLGEREPRRGGDDLGNRDQARRQKKERTENGYADERQTPPDFEERKVASFPTRKRHPPPPTSPTFQPPTGPTRTSDTPGTRQEQRPTGPPHEKFEIPADVPTVTFFGSSYSKDGAEAGRVLQPYHQFAEEIDRICTPTQRRPTGRPGNAQANFLPHNKDQPNLRPRAQMEHL